LVGWLVSFNLRVYDCFGGCNVLVDVVLFPSLGSVGFVFTESDVAFDGVFK